MKIPVFVSCPSTLSKTQNASRRILLNEVERLGLEPQSVGQSDYPTELPLREVLLLVKHCSGGLVLGFEQFRANGGVWKPGSKAEKKATNGVTFATPWNQIEAALIFSLGLPVLVFREETVSEGVFEVGATDVFVHTMPTSATPAAARTALREMIMKWQAAVRTHYYSKVDTK
jgi:hypothetical protein